MNLFRPLFLFVFPILAVELGLSVPAALADDQPDHPSAAPATQNDDPGKSEEADDEDAECEHAIPPSSAQSLEGNDDQTDNEEVDLSDSDSVQSESSVADNDKVDEELDSNHDDSDNAIDGDQEDNPSTDTVEEEDA